MAKKSQESRRVCCRNAGSRVCHIFFSFIFFVVMVVSLVSLGIFADKHNEIGKELDSSSKCILYVSKTDVSDGKLSGDDACRFAIWGSAAVALGAGFFLVLYLLKVVVGVSILSFLVVVDFLLLILLFLVSFAVSVNTAIGLAMTCDKFKDAGNKGSCKDYTITENNNVHFYESVLIAEILSWAITGALLCFVCLSFILTVVYCCTCGRSRSAEEARETLLESRKKKSSMESASASHSYETIDNSTNPFT